MTTEEYNTLTKKIDSVYKDINRFDYGIQVKDSPVAQELYELRERLETVDLKVQVKYHKK